VANVGTSKQAGGDRVSTISQPEAAVHPWLSHGPYRRRRRRHGQYIRSTDRRLISIEDTFLWLSRGGLTRETEYEIIAA